MVRYGADVLCSRPGGTMALPIDKLGTKSQPFTAPIDPERAKAYAAATNDDNPAYTSGKYAPPVFGVVPTWDAVVSGVGTFIPAEVVLSGVHVDDDQTYRYRDASGDTMPIHVDNDVAKSVGLPGIIAHGLCTMAMCSQGIIKTLADGDPSRLRRLAVRFSKPVFPGNDVVVTM